MESGLDMEELDARRFMHVIAELFINDGIGPYPDNPEVIKARDKARARVLRILGGEDPGYDSYEQYGSSNDDYGHPSDKPLPFIPPTEQTDDGYVGLDPPLGM